jgi:glycosyltransferase involved in cell wall biosynthesis
MNCYNGDKFLCEAIDSALKQTYSNLEIIFWDNASTDNTANLVKAYNDPRVKYFRGEKNVPLYHARNFALEKCNGEFIAFLDIDDLWSEDKLEKQIPLFNNPKVGIVFSDTYFLKDGKIIHQYFKSKKPHRGHCFNELIKDYFLSLETVIVRKKCFEDWKEGFDERFNHIGDSEMFIRMSYYWDLDFVDEPLGVWRVHATSLSFKNQQGFYQETELMIKKYEEIIPDFKTKHQTEIRELKKQVAIWKSKLFLLKKERENSIREITPFIFSPKAFALFLFSLLPYQLSTYLLKKRDLA